MLFFSPGPEPTQFAVTNVTTQPTVAFGNPARVPRRYLAGSPIAPRRYDIAPDGRFIGLIQPGLAATSQPEIHIVFNWFEELKRLVPTQ